MVVNFFSTPDVLRDEKMEQEILFGQSIDKGVANAVITSTNVMPGIYTDTISIVDAEALNSPQKMWVSYELTHIRGDLNHDGFLAPSDAVLQLNCVFLGSGADCELFTTDMNCDGQLSPSDAILLLQRIYLNAPAAC
jgi:hypothetical protein